MRRLLPFAAILILALGLAPSTNGRVPIGTLAGIVFNVRGEPAPNAVVAIQASDGVQPFATHTDSSGHFRFLRLETGQYDLRASLGRQLSEWTKRVMVHANKTTQVTLRLSPDGP